MNTKSAVYKPRERPGTDSSLTDLRRKPQARFAFHKDHSSTGADDGCVGVSPDKRAQLFDGCHPPGE